VLFWYQSRRVLMVFLMLKFVKMFYFHTIILLTFLKMLYI